MSTQIQYRRGTGAQNDAFVGALAEITVDTTNWTLRIADGVTTGGYSLVGLDSTQTLTNKVYNGTSVSVTGNVTGNFFIGNGSQLTGLSASKIYNGTSEANIGASGGNANITIGGTSNVVVVATTGVYVSGVVSATGNVTGNFFIGNGSQLTGLSASKIYNGTSEANIGASGGNANISIGGTSNVAVFATTGEYITGLISASGNITGGNLTTAGIITVNSGAAATAIVNGASNAVGNIGSSSTYFNRLFAQATTALYADLAEVYRSDANYAPGTVLIFGGNQEVTISTTSHDARIAGVVSTHPAHVMNSGLESEFTVEVGLVGRVPCQVVGPISAGDRVVSSNLAGVAERLDISRYQPGVIIGKAVESYNGEGVGTIEVVVGRL